MNKKEFDEKFNKAAAKFTQNFINENQNKLIEKINNEFKENPDDNNLAWAGVIGDITAYSLQFSVALIKDILESKLVDKK